MGITNKKSHLNTVSSLGIQRIKRMRFQTILILLITITLICCVIGITIFSHTTYKQNLINQVALARIDVLMQTSEKVESIQKNMVSLSGLYEYKLSSLQSSPLAHDQWPKELDIASNEYHYAMQAIDIDCYVTLLNTPAGNYSTLKSLSEDDILSMQKELWFLRIPSQIDENQVFWTQSHHEGNPDSSFVFSLVRRPSFDQNILILINIPERILFDTYKSVTSNNMIYIINSDGRIISQNNESMINLGYFNMSRLDELVTSGNYTIIEKSGESYLLSRYDNEEFGLKYIEEIPLNDLLKPMSNIQIMTISFSALLTLIACIVIIIVVSTLSAPLAKMCKKLQRVSEGKFDTVFDIESWAEINLINDASQEMVSRISDLFDDLKEKERQKRLAEIDFLQAQINPHFMYNTLFSIRCLINIGETESAEHMLDSFTGMLRTVLESKDDIITLQQEISSLQQYFDVLQCRYGEDIRLTLDIPQSLLNFKTLKFILQPIVENSVFHGLEPNGCKGEINISARESDNNLILEVRDDGAGMSYDQLKNMHLSIQSAESNNVGIANVLKRIHLHFGTDYGLQITSKLGQGTSVILTLPKIEE